MTPARSRQGWLIAGLMAAALGVPSAVRATNEAVVANFGLAVDLCLQHLRDRNPVDAFRTAGFEVTPADEGTFDFMAYGVEGYLAPLTLEQWCWVQSDALDFATVQRIGHERALFRYPQGVAGAPRTGATADGCPSLNVAHANRLWTLGFKNVPFWEGCDRPETGGIMFN